jgi:ankyrin repeat protein
LDPLNILTSRRALLGLPVEKIKLQSRTLNANMKSLAIFLLLVDIFGCLGAVRAQAVKNGGKTTPLHQAAVDADEVRLKELLDSGGDDVNAIDENGRTPLAAADGYMW